MKYFVLAFLTFIIGNISGLYLYPIVEPVETNNYKEVADSLKNEIELLIVKADSLDSLIIIETNKIDIIKYNYNDEKNTVDSFDSTAILQFFSEYQTEDY